MIERMERFLRPVETEVINEVHIGQFPEIPANSSVVHHLWRNLPEIWDGDCNMLRLQLITPGHAGRAFAAFAADGNCVNANFLPYFMQKQMPENYYGKIILLPGTLFADLRTSQQYVLGINSVNRKQPISHRVLSSSNVPDKTYALVFKD